MSEATIQVSSRRIAPALEFQAGRMPLKVVAGATLAMFLWALCFPLINVGLSASPPMAFAAIRAVISGVVLLLVAQWTHRPAVSSTALWGSVALVGFTATSLGFFGMFYGGGLVSPGLATVIANTQPLIAALLAWVVLGERLRSVHRWGLLAGFAGIVLIGGPNVSGDAAQITGIVYILLGAVGVAISNVTLARIAGRIDVFRAVGWQLVFGSVPLGLLSVVTEDFTAIHWSPEFILTLLALSIGGTSAVFVLWFWLLHQAALSRLNVFTFLTPIFGLLMGMAFFNERLQSLAIGGVALSLVGIFLVTRPAKSNSLGPETTQQVHKNQK